MTAEDFSALEEKARELAGDKPLKNDHFIKAARDRIATLKADIQQIEAGMEPETKEADAPPTGDDRPQDAAPSAAQAQAQPAPTDAGAQDQPAGAPPSNAPVVSENTALEANTEERAQRAKARIERAYDDGLIDDADVAELTQMVDEGDIGEALVQLTNIANPERGVGRGRAIASPGSTAVSEEVVAQQVDNLPAAQVATLEKHYGLESDSPQFLSKVKEDVVRYATEGVRAVSAAIRHIIRSIHAGVLSVAMIFNPMQMTSPEAFVVVPKAQTVVESTVTREVRAELPSDVRGMSEAGRQAYSVLIPALKGKIGDKLITIADKPSGQIFVFDSAGNLVIQKKALFGLAKGDLYKGNNDLPQNRITPAGLFGLKLVDAAKGGSAKKTAGEYDFGKVFAFEDPDAVVTIMHSVWLKEKDAGRRAAALKNDNAADSRYSFGCINVDRDTYKMLLDNHQSQMDGSKLFIVPDNQAQVGDFLSGNVPYDKMARESVQPATETITTRTTQTEDSTQASGTRTLDALDRRADNQRRQGRSTTRFRANKKPTAPIAFKSLNAIVGRLARALGVDIQIAETPQEVGLNPPEGTNPAGAFHQGKLYLFRQNIPDGLEGEKTVFHEVFHKGLRRVLKDSDYIERLNDLYNTNPEVRRRADEWLETDEANAWREYYAKQQISPQAQFEWLVAHAADEGLATVAEDLNTGKKVGSVGSPWQRTLASWMAKLADFLGLKALAQRIRSFTLNEIERLVQQSVNAARDTRAPGDTRLRSPAGDSSVRWTADRIQRLIDEFGYTDGRTKAFAAYVDPEAFLRATTISREQEESIRKEAGALDRDRLAGYQGTPFLYWDKDNGRVVGHEGRHRMAALAREGAGRAPVIVVVYDGEGYRVAARQTPIDYLSIEGQTFDNGGGRRLPVGLSNMVPLSYEYTKQLNEQFGGEADIRYRMSGVQRQAMDALDGLGDSKVGTLAKRALHSSMFLRDLAAKYGGRNKAIKAHVDEVFEMSATEADLQERAVKVQDALNKVPAKQRKAVTELMADATAAGVYVEESEGRRNTHMTTDAQRATVASLQARFNALTDVQKQAYRVARDELRANWQKRGELLGRVAEDIYDPLIKAQRDAGNDQAANRLEKQKNSFISDVNARLSTIKGDYFPEMRFGDYVVVRRSAAYKALSDQVDAALKEYNDALDAYELTPQQRKANKKAGIEDMDAETKERISGLRKTYEKLQADLEEMKAREDDYLVEFFESKAAANEYAKQVGGEAGLRRERIRDIMPLSRGVLKQMEDSLELTLRSQGNAGALRDAKRALFEVYLQSLPDLSALKRQAKRRNVAGFSRDMQRAIASSMLSDSFHLARLEHMDRVQETLNQAWETAKGGGIDMQEVVAELDRRHAASMKYSPTPVQDVLAGVGQLYMLGISPGYLLSNMLQPWMVSAPMLVARHGMKSLSALGSAYSDVAKMVQRAAKESGLRGEIKFDGVGLKPREVDMLNALLRSRLINVTLTGDLNAATQGKDTSGLLRRGLRLMSLPSHHFEVVNRISTALAAYRMEVRNGNEADAIAYAQRVLADTHFDYSSENAPYWMKPGVVPGSKMLFQFKKYQAGMISMYAKTIAAAVGSDPAARREARRMLTGLFITHGAVTGMLGLPAMGSALAIANVIASAFGDDEPKDIENDLRNWLLDVTGDKQLANVLAKGLPTLIGADLSEKVGAGNLVNPAPTLRTDKNGRDLFLELLATGLGPVIGGLGPRMFDGASQFADGNFAKGVEAFLPKFVSDVLRAGRFAEEGITTRRGVEFVGKDQLDGMDILLQALGVPPIKATDAYQARADIEDRKRWVNETTSSAKSAWAQADKAGDAEARNEAWEEIQKLNEIRRANGFKPITRAELIQFARQRTKQESAYAKLGANVGKNARLAEVGRFATAE